MANFQEIFTRKRKAIKRISSEKSKAPKKGLLPHQVPLKDAVEKLLLSLIFTLSVIILILVGAKEPMNTLQVLGIFLLVFSLNFLFGKYFGHFQKELLSRISRLGTFFLLCISILVVAKVSVLVENWPPYLIPLSLVSIILALVFNQRFAMEVSGFLLLYVAFILRNQPKIEIFYTLFMLLGGSIIATLSMGRIRKRSKLIKVGFLIGIIHMVILMSLLLLTGDFESLGKVEILNRLGWVFFHGIAVGFVISGILPFIEVLFNVTTDINLLEITNQNEQPVLRKLLLEAPGTFYHGFIVGSLAEAAAEGIGSNALLAKAGAYFHDIGKLVKPEYFSENEAPGESRHKNLSPTMSKLIICAHTKDGVELGKYYDLPPGILEIIQQHHGTSVVEYFYDAALNKGERDGNVDVTSFRYPGPKPKGKEAAIVLLADSVEAASRTVSDPAPSRIENLIHEIVMKKLLDSQLDDSGLTFRELRKIEECFKQVLVGMYHSRPFYPQFTHKYSA